jgi:predicted RNA-binding Zn-ribbon protein involved in translation (DUF1610 family)
LFSPATESAPAGVEEPRPSVAADAPDILPFANASRTVILSGRFQAPVDRAQLISRNRVCPECGHQNIEPLELDNALISPRNRLPVPGTASIVGFHCNDCGSEWPVYELTRRSV